MVMQPLPLLLMMHHLQLLLLLLLEVLPAPLDATAGGVLMAGQKNEPAIYKETVRCVCHPAPASTSPLYTPCFWWCTRTFPQNHQSKTHAPNPCICRQARTEARCTDCCRQGCTSCCCLDLNTWQALFPLLCVFHYHQYQYMYWHGHHCGCTLRLEQGAGAYIEHARGYDCRCGVGCLWLLWSR